MSGARLIEIKPKSEFLSAAELIVQRHVEVETPHIGLKRTTIECSAAEQQELQSAYANLRRQLSARRIERYAGRAIAVWHANQQAAEVLRKDGKFESFGYNANGKLYLEYYEALFLLELNRLQLEYGGMVVSVEQAYELLLGETSSERYNNYLVYSDLSRAGYIVVKHQTSRRTAIVQQTSMNQQAPTDQKSITSEDCIWALLAAAVSNQPVPTHIKASPFYDAADVRMKDLKRQIMIPTTTDGEDHCVASDFTFDTRKRRAQSEPEEEEEKEEAESTSKRVCLTLTSKSLVDMLKADANYLKFQEIFEKIDIVQLQADKDMEMDTKLRSFSISFDLHLHNEGFRRSAPKLPSFSVLVLPIAEPFPTHDELLKCQQQQRRQQQLPHVAPLLIISVSESKQIQAFLYYIS